MQDLLLHTPKYVYFILLYLLFAGVRASRYRIVYIYKTAMIAGAFLYLSISGILKVDLDFVSATLYIAVVILSTFVGWFRVANAKILVDKEKKLIALPGSWITLGLLLLIFCSKYYLGYNSFQNPDYVHTFEAKVITVLTAGFSFGVILGRLINYFYRFKMDPHTKLSQGDRAHITPKGQGTG